MGNDDEFAELQRSGDDLFSERSGVVLVCVAYLFDETVGAEAFQQT